MRRALYPYDTQSVRLLTPFQAIITAGILCSLAAIGSQRLNADGVAAAPISQASAESAPAESAVTQPQPDQPAAIAGVASETQESDRPSSSAESTVSVGSLPAAMTTPVEGGVADGEKARGLMAAINAARESDGLPPLERNSALDGVATTRARDMVRNGYFDHFSPAGTSAFSEMAALGITYRLAGENLARNSYGSENSLHVAFESLMASPGHRANIMEPQFRRLGVAAVQSGRMWLYVTVFTSAN